MNQNNKQKVKRALKKISCGLLIFCLCTVNITGAWASSISKAEQEKKKAEQELDSVKKKVNELEQNKSSASTKLATLGTDLSEVLATIQILEGDMNSKQAEIDQAELDYAAAQEQESKQYISMKKRIKYMYEAGDTQYLDVLLKAKSMSELLNKAEYINDLYEYDKNMLDTYTETKNQVSALHEELEQDKDDMEVIEEEHLRQKADLEVMITKKRKEVNNFDAQLSTAKKDADAYTKAVEAQTAKIRQLKEEEAKKAAEAAKKAEAARKAAVAAAAKANAKPKTTTQPGPSGKTSNSTTANKGPGVKSSGGTAQGRAIADYGLQFVGNPYVYGGTSLTNGADCSGFTKGVYAKFGISLPRTSSEQSRVGQSISFEDIQPGDLVFYAGHVAISIGNGQIVHASSAKTGIKVSNVAYRTILGIRRNY